jgi:serine/threonine-protein kinase RsbW
VSERRDVKLSSRIESVEEAAKEAEDFARQARLGDEYIFAIDMAVRESVANAVKHGNRFDESKSVELLFELESNVISVTVRDYGSGFNAESIPDPTNPENHLKANGRGILFMKTFMDDVEFTHPAGGGTAVKMLKKL